MLQVADSAFAAFGEVLDALRVFLLMVLCDCDVPLDPALRDGAQVFGGDLECGEVFLWFERSNCAGDGYSLADHAPMAILVIRRFCLHSRL